MNFNKMRGCKPSSNLQIWFLHGHLNLTNIKYHHVPPQRARPSQTFEKMQQPCTILPQQELTGAVQVFVACISILRGDWHTGEQKKESTHVSKYYKSDFHTLEVLVVGVLLSSFALIFSFMSTISLGPNMHSPLRDVVALRASSRTLGTP